jgi:hypothetical protein
MDYIRRYISKSWISVNVTSIVNSSMELQMIFCWWYAIFTDGYTDKQIKTLTELYTVFFRLYIWQTSRGKYWQNEVGNLIILRALFVFWSINIFISDRLTDRPEIIDESFSNRLFLSMNLSLKYLSMNCKYK